MIAEDDNGNDLEVMSIVLVRFLWNGNALDQGKNAQRFSATSAAVLTPSTTLLTSLMMSAIVSSCRR